MGDSALTDEDLRVAVVGPAGSGKTRFAKSLARNLGVAYLNRDSHCWESNWTPGNYEVVKHA